MVRNKRERERGEKTITLCGNSLSTITRGRGFLLEGRDGNSPRKMDRTRKEVVNDFYCNFYSKNGISYRF